MSSLDWSFYVNNYDLENINSEKDAYEHWINIGKIEERISNKTIITNDNVTYNNFQYNYYISNNPQLIDANVSTKDEAWNHWIHHGKKQNLITPNCITNLDNYKIKKHMKEFGTNELNGVNIIYYGPCGTSGFGNVIMNNIYILSLMGANVKFVLTHFQKMNMSDINNIKMQIMLNCVKNNIITPDFIFYNDSIYYLDTFIRIYKNKFPFVKIISWTIFETNKLPEKWYSNLLLSDKVVFPSEYNYDSYSKRLSIEKCIFIPSFIENNFKLTDNNEITKNLAIFSNYKYKYYFIGQYNFRKNIKKLLNIFKNTFIGNTDVCLFIKTFIGSGDESKLLQYNNEIPKIIIETELYSENQINILHELGDYYVNCSHSEGIGLGLLNASCINKVISMDKGGHNSYLDHYYKLTGKECKVNYEFDLNIVSKEFVMNNYSDYTEDMEWFDYEEHDMKVALINIQNFEFISNKVYIDMINDSIKDKFISLFRTDIILLQQYYQVNYVERQNEIDEVLQLNLNNVFINKIILLNERKYDFTKFSNNHKIEQVVINKRLTFKYSFDYIKNLHNNIIILSNNDIEFTEDIQFLNNHCCDNIVYCLTRHDNGSYKNANCGQYMYSQDTWIFKSNINIDTTNLDYYYGRQYCDNVLVYELNIQNIYTFNTPNDIKVIHHHDSMWRNNIIQSTEQLSKSKNDDVFMTKTLPIFVIDIENIPYVMKLKDKFYLNALSINYFIKLFDILSINKSEYEDIIIKVTTNLIKETAFTKEAINLINNSPEILEKEIFIKFIQQFYYYGDQYILNSYKDIVFFVFDVFFYIYVSKNHRKEIDNSIIFYKDEKGRDIDNLINIIKNTLKHYETNKHLYYTEYQNLFSCVDFIKNIIYTNKDSEIAIDRQPIFKYTDNYELFDWQQYITHYPDISFYKNKEEAWHHWLKWGKNEGRQYFKLDIIYELFDWQQYITYYPDISFYTNKENAWHHWITWGKNEGRQYFKLDITYELFDWKQYITYYQDLSFYKKKEDAWHHWITWGKNEGRQYF